MDQKIDPCNDFYDFACGNYDQNTIIPDDKVSMNIFNHFGDKLIKQILDLLEEPGNKQEIKPFKQTKELYRNCMNISKYFLSILSVLYEKFYICSTAQIDRVGAQPIIKLTEKLGGFPILQGKLWNEFSWDFFRTIVSMRNNGVGAKFIMKMAIDISLNDTSKRIIYVSFTCFYP